MSGLVGEVMSPLVRIIHFGPIIALSIIKCVFFTTLWLTSQWLRMTDSFIPFINYLLYYTFIAIVLYNFFSAVFVGPGFVPKGWRPESTQDIELMQFCGQCDGYKPARSHHCRRCDRCVMKMDHHCPWINNCTGYRNQCYFIVFLLSAVLGSIQSIVLLGMGLYRAFYVNWYLYNDRSDRLVYISMTSLLFTVFSIGLAIGVIVAVGGLLVIQLKIVVRNQTSIEEWIVTKAMGRKRDDVFVYPYNIGIWGNIKQVLFEPIHSGIEWPVIDGCNQYTLTVEQLLQKEEKRNRSVTCVAIEDYSGAWFPISKGWRICVSFPLTDEPRIGVTCGDHILVTRWKKHWLYGERLKTEAHKRERGWFPRRLVVQVHTAK
ncbi:unnamed protein product [Medioppia subpectinata]|uniref:Palmitoyltransferase n=1 Tax=Medioppia subpectinata TaxID=1979941 RepID=A0A7R9KHA7_9ACAR|nr:unnamed protein product [Medioppia subpectinata]CAG2102616.1 unnamed protein product [Medioppia subpectinata]